MSPLPVPGGGTGERTGWAGPIRVSRGVVGAGGETCLLEAQGVPGQEDKRGEALRCSKARFTRGLVTAWAIDSVPADTAVPGTTGPSVSTKADCDESAAVVPLDMRSVADVFRFRLTVGVDTGV